MTIIGAVRFVLVPAGAATVVGGCALAARPFTLRVGIADGTAMARCRPPCVAASDRTPAGELALWAVTYGDGPMGYEVRSGAEPHCARTARRRIAVAVALIGAGFVAAIVGVCTS